MDSVQDQSVVRSWSLSVAWATLVAGLAIAGALVFLAFNAPPPAFQPAGAVGSLQTVTLVSGQVFFGRLTAVDHDSVVLTDVYEAVTSTDPATKQQITRLVSRRLADWHGPLDMTIPDREIQFIETIGPESSVGKAILHASQPPPETTPAKAAPSTH